VLEILKDAQGMMNRFRLVPLRHGEQVPDQRIDAAPPMQPSIDGNNFHMALFGLFSLLKQRTARQITDRLKLK
jgi:hypothetical protein